MEAGISSIEIVKIISSLITAIVAVSGWFVAYQVNKKQELARRKLELRIEHLIRAYRALERASFSGKDSDKKEFEEAIADVYLFGSGRQIEEVNRITKELEKTGNVSVKPLLILLRKELRHELGMKKSNDVDDINIFRFK